MGLIANLDMSPQGGVEPLTLWLTTIPSNQLSYWSTLILHKIRYLIKIYILIGRPWQIMCVTYVVFLEMNGTSNSCNYYYSKTYYCFPQFNLECSLTKICWLSRNASTNLTFITILFDFHFSRINYVFFLNREVATRCKAPWPCNW